MDSQDRDLILLLAAAGPCSLDSSPGKNWVEKSGGLPNYICHIAKGVMKSGKSKGQAIAIAVSRVKAWAAGGSTNSRGGPEVTAATRAKAAKAVAQWTALKAKNAARKVVKASRVDGSQYLVLSETDSYSMEMVSRAWRAKEHALHEAEEKAKGGMMSDSMSMESPSIGEYRYISEVWSDYVIVSCEDGQYLKIPYTVTSGMVDFGEPVNVEQQWVENDQEEVDDVDTDLDDVERALLADVLQVTKEDKSFLEQIRAVVGQG